ncbi:MAG: hypothetical protein ACI4NM_08820 [Bullifex sp.]
MIKAIVYTSKSGSTEAYARMLSVNTGIPAHSLRDALKTLPRGCEVAYLGCVRADTVLDLSKALKFFSVRMVCAVGMGKTGENEERIRNAFRIDPSIAVFTLQGNYHPDELKGADRLIMKMMSGVLIKQLREKGTLSADDEEMIKLLTEGGDKVSEENISAPLEWIRSRI